MAIKLHIETDCQKRQETSIANDDTEPESSASISMPPASNTLTSSNITSTAQSCAMLTSAKPSWPKEYCETQFPARKAATCAQGAL